MLMRDPSYLNKTNEMAPLVSHKHVQLPQKEKALQISTTENQNSQTKNPEQRNTTHGFHDSFGLHLLKDWMFVMYLISIALTYLPHISLHWFIPDRAIEIGLSKHDSSVTITVLNAANILSRLAFGVTTANGFFSHVVILVVYVFLSGLNSILIIIWTTYWSYMIFAVLFGLLRGLYIIYMLLVVVDLVGKDQVGLGLGLTYTLNGLVFLVSIPVFGYYNEVTHSYTTTFILYGGLEIIGGFFLVTIPIYLYTKKANQMVKPAGQ